MFIAAIFLALVPCVNNPYEDVDPNGFLPEWDCNTPYGCNAQVDIDCAMDAFDEFESTMQDLLNLAEDLWDGYNEAYTENGNQITQERTDCLADPNNDPAVCNAAWDAAQAANQEQYDDQLELLEYVFNLGKASARRTFLRDIQNCCSYSCPWW